MPNPNCNKPTPCAAGCKYPQPCDEKTARTVERFLTNTAAAFTPKPKATK